MRWSQLSSWRVEAQIANVGANWTRALLLSMGGAVIVYGAALWLSWSLCAHGLWLSFTLFLLTRAALQLALLPRLLDREFGQPS